MHKPRNLLISSLPGIAIAGISAVGWYYITTKFAESAYKKLEPIAIYKIDVNDDGRKDIMTESRSGKLTYMLKDKNGNFVRGESVSEKDLASKLGK